MTEQELTVEVAASIAFILLVSALFGEHLRHAYVDWRELRDGRSLRAFLLAVALESSLVGLLFSSLFRAGILSLDVTTFVGYMIRGVLIAVGIVDVVSWHSERRGASKQHRPQDREF